MLFDSWFVLQAAELAQQAAAHVALTVATVQHEAHLLLDEITQLSPDLIRGEGGINGGCEVH